MTVRWRAHDEGFALMPVGRAGATVVGVAPGAASFTDIADTGADAVVLPWPIYDASARAARRAGLGIVADASPALAAWRGTGAIAGRRAGRALAAAGEDVVGLWLVADVDVVPARGMRFAQFAARGLGSGGAIAAAFMEDRRAGRAAGGAVFARLGAPDPGTLRGELSRVQLGARRLPVVAELPDCESLGEMLRLAADLGVAAAIVPAGRLEAVRELRAYEEARLEAAPLVSVVVCAYNAAGTLEGCLRSLEALRYPRYEVVVVDDGSTDDTAEIARRSPHARLVELGMNQGLSAARNRGAQEARGEIVAYLDADAEATPDWLAWAWRGMQAFGADGIGGPNLPFPDAGLRERAVSGAPGVPVPALDPDGRAEHVAGCNMVLRRDLVLGVGFEPGLRTSSDDVRFCVQALERGARLAYHSRAAVLHHRRPTLRSFLRQQRAYGVSIGAETGVEQMTWVAPEATAPTPWTSRLDPLRRRYVFTGAQEQGLYAQREYAVRTAFPLRVLGAVAVVAVATLLPARFAGRLRVWAGGTVAAVAGTLAWVVASVPLYRPQRGTALVQRLLTAALWLAQPIVHARGRRAAQRRD